MFQNKHLLQKLLLLINERLNYMEQVAAYKWQKKMPIIDLKSSNYVMEHVSDLASQCGLPCLNIVSEIFKLQIDLAVIVQERWFQWWEKNGFIDVYGDLDVFNMIFPEIIRVGDLQLSIIKLLKETSLNTNIRELDFFLRDNIKIKHLGLNDLEKLKVFIVTQFN